MKTVSIINQKGGVGKTTTASSLSAGLVRRGFRCLTIDSDPQGNLTASIGIDTEESATLDDLMSGRNNLEEVLKRGTVLGDFIPCSLSLADADRRFTQFASFRILKKILSAVEDRYDYCVIDSPPSLGILSLNALIASDAVIVPVNAAAFSIQGINALVRVIEEVRSENPGIYIMGILITRFNGRTVLSKDVVDVLNTIASNLDTKVFVSKIRQGVAVEAAQADHLDIFTAAPRSGVAKDYESFITEFLEEDAR